MNIKNKEKGKKELKEIIRYIIAGVLTTVVSLVSYFLLVHTVLDATNPLQLQVANVISWICAVVFAFFVNRKYVFNSKSERIWEQFFEFSLSRLGTLIIEMLTMFVLVSCLKIDDGVSKIAAQFIVLVFNYVFSKFWVFGKKEKNKKFDMREIWRTRKKEILGYGVVFVLLMVLCYLFPYGGDDWAWGSSIGLDRLNNGFENYGGRYVGYLIVIAMARYRILRAVVMAVVLCGIGFYVRKLVGVKWAFGMAIVLMLMACRDIVGQAIVWTSGFANYAVTALIVLVFLAICIEIWQGERKEKLWAIFTVPILGLLGSLIMENVTIYFVLLPVAMQVVLWKKEKRFSYILLGFFCGAVLGAILMFANSAYSNIANHQDGYRAMEFSLSAMAHRGMDNYIGSIHPYGMLYNVILNMVLWVGGFLALILKKKKIGCIAGVCLGVFGVYVVFDIIRIVLVGATVRPDVVVDLEAAFSLIALMALVVISFKTMLGNKWGVRKMGLLWATFFVLVAPLFIIEPIGPRNFFAPYVLLVTICLLMWREAFAGLKEGCVKIYKLLIPRLKIVENVLLVATICCFIGVFGVIYIADESRMRSINEGIERGDKTVVLERLPFECMTWDSSPGNKKLMERFKLFYGIPEDVEVEVSPPF